MQIHCLCAESILLGWFCVRAPYIVSIQIVFHIHLYVLLGGCISFWANSAWDTPKGKGSKKTKNTYRKPALPKRYPPPNVAFAPDPGSARIRVEGAICFAAPLLVPNFNGDFEGGKEFTTNPTPEVHFAWQEIHHPPRL